MRGVILVAAFRALIHYCLPHLAGEILTRRIIFACRNRLTEHEISGDALPGAFFSPRLSHLMPDGQGGFIVAADNTATIYRVSSVDELVGPLSVAIPDNGTDHIVQMALGENGAVALVQDWWGSFTYTSIAPVVFFDPLTLTITQSQTLEQEPELFPRMLSHTLARGGVVWTDMNGGFATEIAPGFLAGWNVALGRRRGRDESSKGNYKVAASTRKRIRPELERRH